MSVHTTTNIESAELLIGSLAVSGVTTSLAASAAELLREDPHLELGDRFRAALEAVEQRLMELVEHPADDAINELFTPVTVASTEPELLAALSSTDGSHEETQRVNQFREFAKSMAESIHVLLEDPTSEAAESAEVYLAQLSDAEFETVQIISAKVRDAEDPVFSYLSH